MFLANFVRLLPLVVVLYDSGVDAAENQMEKSDIRGDYISRLSSTFIGSTLQQLQR